MPVRIGTSGWNYPNGRGTWNGVFYPLPEDRERGFDELRFYAERFNTVEVNSTFYGQPRANTSLNWVKRTPEDFEFAIKLYQKFTHPDMTIDRTPVVQADVDAFRGGIEPLAAAGKLGPLLIQFPASFQRTQEAVDYVAWLLTAFAHYQRVVEFRHRSWSDAGAATLALLNEHRAALVRIDEPKFESSIRPDWSVHESGIYYVRFHGRNAKEWWDHAESEDRYNYFYSEEELEPIADKARKARDQKKRVYLMMNNHFSAQSVANATTLKKMLDEPITAKMPAELVDRFPALARIVSTLPRARLL
ncbi:MAG TPA: DUF72 domain-containing protein [Vicinamibacterales bacterium]|nr:DUF72 domain-containing protein [Vicinamibacterales bacterium]